MLAALVLHTVVALVAPRRPADTAETATIAERVTIARRTPVPSPPPTPTPLITPKPHDTLAPQIAVRAPAPKAAATPHVHSGGAAAPIHAVHVTKHAHRAPPVSIVQGTHAGVQNGGAGTGAGAGTGDSGLGGAGTGSDTAGTGNGGDANTAPCGDIYILPAQVSYRKDGTVLQNVLAKIVMRDGTVEVDRFPYPFVYPGVRQDPFQHNVGLSEDGGVPVQEPPPDADVTRYPVAVQIVLKYTDPHTGRTSLPACTAPQDARTSG